MIQNGITVHHLEPKSGLPNIPVEGSSEASINIQLVRLGLVILVDQEHGTDMDHIASASATNHVTLVGYTTVFVNALKKEIWFPFSLPVKNKPHNKVCAFFLEIGYVANCSF